MGKEWLCLPKLISNGTNWIAYHDCMEWSLKMRGLGDHLTHKATTILYFNTSQIGRFSPAQQWVRDEVTASGLLDMTIPDELFREIKNLNTMMEVWAKLKELFEGKLRSIMVDLGRKFRTTCCREDNDIHSHFSKLADLCNKLAVLGRAVSDDEYIAVLIRSLPPSYNSPINSLTSSCDINNIKSTSLLLPSSMPPCENTRNAP